MCASERGALDGSDAAAGSPSSTPETDALVRETLSCPTVTDTILSAKLTLKCEELERERNRIRRLYETERLDHNFCQKTVKRIIHERDTAAELLAEIMRDEVNHQDESEKWLRAYAPHHLISEKNQPISGRN